MPPSLRGACCAALLVMLASAQEDRLVFPGGKGPGAGKRIVLVSGDEEYRSEEALPQLARILSERHGFHCTVLFAIDPRDGTINPSVTSNIPGLESLDTADLLVLFTRFRDLPDAQMKHFVDYFDAGKPIVAIRTATHAFDLKSSPTYRRFSWNNKEWDGGFGRRILGETWIDHHGRHKVQSTRAVIAPGAERNPILRGIASGSIWVPTDVYKVRLPLEGVQTLLLGQVLTGMNPSDSPAPGTQNDPMMPVAWTKSYTGASGRTGRVFTTTMGSSQDFLNEELRRLVVNACYWASAREGRIPAKADVTLVGDYKPLPFGFGGQAKGVTPSALRR